jgi:ribosomal protein S6--L-glutamate ligase
VRIVAFLERGRPPRENPLFVEALARLESRGHEVVRRWPEEECARLDRLSVDADLYLLKSNTDLALSLALALEGMGARVLNRAEASAAVRDKALAAFVLAAAGVPTPLPIAAARPALLAPMLEEQPLVLKPNRGFHGAGVAFIGEQSMLPADDDWEEIAFAQEWVHGDEVKAFAVGGDVFAVRKSFAPDSYLRIGEPVALSADAVDVVHRTGRALGLELYGVDLVMTGEGSVVVDVNTIPGYRGVPDAARRLADAVEAAAS